MKKILLFSILLAATSIPAWALIPSGSINQATLLIHGIYTTSDPACKADLVATVPLKKTAVPFNLAASPSLGNGLAADPIKCVIFVMQAKATVGWNAGNYTSSTGGNSDSVCNSGGSTSFALCPASVTTFWPDAIRAQADAIGLNRTETCTGADTNIMPLYLSVDSLCTGNTSVDPSGCNSGYNVSMPPTAANMPMGIKITQPTGDTGVMTFKVDVSRVVGYSGGVCGSPNPPTFGFVDGN